MESKLIRLYFYCKESIQNIHTLPRSRIPPLPRASFWTTWNFLTALCTILGHFSSFLSYVVICINFLIKQEKSGKYSSVEMFFYLFWPTLGQFRVLFLQAKVDCAPIFKRSFLDAYMELVNCILKKQFQISVISARNVYLLNKKKLYFLRILLFLADRSAGRHIVLAFRGWTK